MLLTSDEVSCCSSVSDGFRELRMLMKSLRNRFQVGGSVLAGKLAIEKGWAINIGGGFHHCSKDKGRGFCPYADISLLIQELFDNYPSVRKAMIVDLDAHQVSVFPTVFCSILTSEVYVARFPTTSTRK